MRLHSGGSFPGWLERIHFAVSITEWCIRGRRYRRFCFLEFVFKWRQCADDDLATAASIQLNVQFKRRGICDFPHASFRKTGRAW